MSAVTPAPRARVLLTTGRNRDGALLSLGVISTAPARERDNTGYAATEVLAGRRTAFRIAGEWLVDHRQEVGTAWPYTAPWSPAAVVIEDLPGMGFMAAVPDLVGRIAAAGLEVVVTGRDRDGPARPECKAPAAGGA